MRRWRGPGDNNLQRLLAAVPGGRGDRGNRDARRCIPANALDGVEILTLKRPEPRVLACLLIADLESLNLRQPDDGAEVYWLRRACVRRDRLGHDLAARPADGGRVEREEV